MADRLVKVLANDRLVASGLSRVSTRTVQMNLPSTDIATVKIDYTRWLDTDTLSSIATVSSGVTVSVSTSTPSTTLTLSAVADAANVQVLATSSGGRKHTLWIDVNEADRVAVPANIAAN